MKVPLERVVDMKKLRRLIEWICASRWRSWGLAAGALAIVVWAISMPGSLDDVDGCVQHYVWVTRTGAHHQELFWRRQIAHGIIDVSYWWISALAGIVWWRLKLPFAWVWPLIGAFVWLCGNGHGMDILTAFKPLYILSTNWHQITALVSLGVAIAFTAHLPLILRKASEFINFEERLKKALAAEAEARQKAEAAAQHAIEGEAIANQERLTAEQHTAELHRINRELEASREAVRSLQVIVLHAWRTPRTLLVPVQGTVDTRRIGELQDAIAAAVEKHEAKFVIVDFAGVDFADTSVVQCMLDIQTMLKLLGARCAITGLRRAVAQTMTSLIRNGDQQAPATTLLNLADGMELAIGARGLGAAQAAAAGR